MGALSQFMCEPRQVHWVATKHVLRYLCGTVGYGLRYTSSGDMRLQGFSNFDWAGSVVNRKSTCECCFNLGSIVISWGSKKQTSVALNTAEAEYMDASTTVRRVVCLGKLLARLFG